MSELKDLSWSVQEQVEPVPFEQLERRGARRRRTRRAVTGGGLLATTGLVALALLLPTGLRPDSDRAPIATIPTAPAPEDVVRDPAATLDSFEMATPTRWISGWSNCVPEPCRYAALLARDGARTTTPVEDNPYVTLPYGDELLAASWPDELGSEPGTLMRTTDGETVLSGLDVVAPTDTFGAGDLLIGRAGGLLVLDPVRSTLRELNRLPQGRSVTSPVRDGTGRWWAVSLGTSGSRSYVVWTDDGGRSWQQALLDPDSTGSTVAVSQNGQTVVATSQGDGATLEEIGTVRLSVDAGRTWRTVRNLPELRDSGPVAFNDGTAVLLGRDADEAKPSAYRIGANGSATRQPSVPLLALGGDGKLLYGRTSTGPESLGIGDTVATSTDRGVTWSTFEPR